VLDELFAADAIVYDSGCPCRAAATCAKEVSRSFCAAFPTFVSAPTTYSPKATSVAVRLVLATATHQSKLEGIAPTTGRLTVTGSPFIASPEQVVGSG